MLMAHNSSETRDLLTATPAATTRTSTKDTDVRLPHLTPGHLVRSDGVQFGLPVFKHVSSDQPTQVEAEAEPTQGGSTSHWNNRQKVQDFFRHTDSPGHGYDPSSTTGHHRDKKHFVELNDEKDVQQNDGAIDIRTFVLQTTASECRKSGATSSTSSEDFNQPDEGRGGIVSSRGRLHSTLEDLLKRQQGEGEERPDAELEESISLRREEERRRRYDSFDILADVRLEDEESDILMDDVHSVDSVDLVGWTSPRSPTYSDDFFYGGELLEMLSQRHMPVGIARHASVADMLANRAFVTPNEGTDEEQKWMQLRPEEGVRQKTDGTGASLTRSKDLTSDRNSILAEMLATRIASPTGSLNKFALDDTIEEAGVPSVIDEAPRASRIDPLAAMLAKRNTPSPPALGDAKEELSGVMHPVTAKQCEQAPAAIAGATGSSAEMDLTPLKGHPTYQKYFKMLAVGLPSTAVKHKMQSESVDPAILDMDPSKPLPEAVGGLVLDKKDEMAYQVQLEEYEAKHGKYSQMVKVGLPVAVVEHKMRMDGVDPAWLHGPPERPEPKAAAASEVTEEKRAAHRKKYHKYFQMLRMGLPRGAVEQKMRMAGLDPAELNGPREGASPAARPKESLKRKNSIRKKLHWEGKNHRPRRDSLWGGDSMEETKEQVQISDESRAMLEKLFVKDLTESNKPALSTKSDGAVTTKKKAMVQLIDLKKSQNIAITLARVKLTFSELKREILAMNPDVLSPSQVRSLMDMWPDRKEMEAIEAFKGDLATIGTAEQFLVEVRSVPRFHEKLACLVYKQEFSSRSLELRESLDLVTRGVYQVCSSAELRQLFIYILQIGNLLNFGGDNKQKGVNAFSLSSLVKFSQTKAFVGGTTFLQYVVQSIERDVPHLAQFDKDIDLISKCSNVAYASLASEKNGLEVGLQKVLSEAESADKEAMVANNDSLIRFCEEAKTELSILQGLLDKLDAAKAHFLEYFEEEDTEEELDVLLSHIANFTTEYRREHSKYLANLKKDTTTKSLSCKNLLDTVEPKQELKAPDTKKTQDVELPQGENGHHSHNVAAHPHQTAMPPQIDHPQLVRRIHHARVLHLETTSQHENMDGVSLSTVGIPKTSVVSSGKL
uniref:FH2 domain-containing protein n=1 Tax=Hyaloperonospora arabidopsidis (strain Emoy2) TaxID=559515 RepID=M4BHW6_HYAAE